VRRFDSSRGRSSRTFPDKVVGFLQTAPTVQGEHRWLLVLLPSFIAAAVFFELAIATGQMWLIGPAVVLARS
jgi:hypothetical protein